MVDYNIEVEIFPDDGEIRVYSDKGREYSYILGSEDGATLLNKIFGSDVRATVYSQNETMTLEEWESRAGI